MVIEAAKMVRAHEFNMNLPGGYDYIIQVQRLWIQESPRL